MVLIGPAAKEPPGIPCRNTAHLQLQSSLGILPSWPDSPERPAPAWGRPPESGIPPCGLKPTSLVVETDAPQKIDGTLGKSLEHRPLPLCLSGRCLRILARGCLLTLAGGFFLLLAGLVGGPLSTTPPSVWVWSLSSASVCSDAGWSCAGWSVPASPFSGTEGRLRPSVPGPAVPPVSVLGSTGTSVPGSVPGCGGLPVRPGAGVAIGRVIVIQVGAHTVFAAPYPASPTDCRLCRKYTDKCGRSSRCKRTALIQHQGALGNTGVWLILGGGRHFVKDAALGDGVDAIGVGTMIFTFKYRLRWSHSCWSRS